MQNFHACVRSSGIFRQGKAKTSSLVSEVWASSDSEMQNYCAYVRSSGIFGQRIAIFPHLCPKLGYLRTEECKITSFVSEVRISSDRGMQNHLAGVRSSDIFEKRMAKLPRWCPKFGYLRKANGKTTSLVSEVRISSDRGVQYYLAGVRSWGIFGQRNAKSPRWCPKFGYLRTVKGKITGLYY